MRPGSNSPRAPRMVRLRDLEVKAFELRMRGKSFQAIADELGCPKPRAWRAVMRAVREHAKVTEAYAGEYLEIEIGRLDKLLDGLWDAATAGSVQAVEAVLKVEARRAKLLGLDAPNRIALGGDDKAPPVKLDLSKLSDTELETFENLMRRVSGAQEEKEKQ